MSAADYRDNVGHEPVERFPADHPDRWQWDYTGARAETQDLLDRLRVASGADDIWEPPLPPEQERLF